MFKCQCFHYLGLLVWLGYCAILGWYPKEDYDYGVTV